MKTLRLFSVLFMFVFSNIVTAQTISNIIPLNKIRGVNKKDNVIAYSYNDFTDNNGYVKFIDENGSPIGNTKIFPKGTYTSTPCVGMGRLAINDQNDMLAAGTIDSDAGGVWNALNKYGTGTNPINGKTVYNIDINNIYRLGGSYYVRIGLISTSDFMSSGWNSMLTYSGSGGEEWFVARLNNDLSLNWVYSFEIGTEPIKMDATNDGNIAVSTFNNKRLVLDSTSGLAIGQPMISSYSCNFFEDENGYVSFSHQNDEVTITYDDTGAVVASTNLPIQNQFGQIVRDVKFNGNDIIIASFASNSMPKISVWQKSLVNPDEYYDVQKRVLPALDSGDIYITGSKILELTNNSITISAMYNSSGGNFHGTTLPSTGGNDYHFVFTYNFDINLPDFSMNDISSPSNNINNVFGFGRYENGVWTAESTGVTYIVYNSSNNIPDVGTEYDDSAWTIPSGMNPIPSGWIDDWKPIIMENDGVKYFYVWALGSSVGGPSKELALMKVMLVSDGTLDLINNAAENDDESSLTVADYENIQVTGVTASNLVAVNNLLAGVDSADLPLTVAEIQVLVTSLNVDNLNYLDFSVYPNPTGDILNLKSASQISEIKMYNLLGQEIFKEYYNNQSEVRVNISNFTEGTYFLKIQDENGNICNAKVIKK